MQTTSTINRDLVNAEKGLGFWIVWAAVLALGLVGWLLMSNANTASVASINRTETAAFRLQGNAELLSAQTRLAALNDPQALATIGPLRSKIQDDLGLLQRGGFLFSDDKNPVEGVGETQRAQFVNMQSALSGFDSAAQPVLGASELLRQGAQAEQSLPPTLKNLADGSIQMGKSQNLSSGNWGSTLLPLRRELTRNELSSLPVVFSPGANSNLARQWAELLADRAEEARRLSDAAVRDATLTTPEKELLVSWLKNVIALSNQLQVLYRSMDARSQAKESVPAVVQASAPLQEAAQGLSAAVHLQRASVEQTNMVKIVFIVAAWIGLGGLIYSIWTMSSNYSLLRGGSVRGAHVVESAERLNRNLRRAINNGGVNQDVSEPADSPLFALSSMITQLLNSISNNVQLVREQNESLTLATSSSDGILSSVISSQQQQQDSLNSIHQNTQSSADNLQSLSQDWLSLVEHFSHLVDAVTLGGAQAKENVWVMDGIRENTQATAKRIKRLSETTQNISTDVETVKDISRKVKVLALNLALEAAPLHAAGRPFLTLAQELERLAQNCDAALKEVDLRIDTIQNDAKETVSSMEGGTSDVVRSGKLSGNTVVAFENVGKAILPLKEQTEGAAQKIKEVSDVLNEEVEHAFQIFQNMQEQNDKITKVSNGFNVLRTVSSTLQKWLHSPLR